MKLKGATLVENWKDPNRNFPCFLFLQIALPYVSQTKCAVRFINEFELLAISVHLVSFHHVLFAAFGNLLKINYAQKMQKQTKWLSQNIHFYGFQKFPKWTCSTQGWETNMKCPYYKFNSVLNLHENSMTQFSTATITTLSHFQCKHDEPPL